MLKVDRSIFFYSQAKTLENPSEKCLSMGVACSKGDQPASQTAEEQRPQEIQASAGSCQERCPIPIAKPWGLPPSTSLPVSSSGLS